MAKDSKKLVQAITSQEENFAQWYTDICVKAELVEYSSVKGFIILRPYGQAIWELIQKDMDARFKATGHENVAMPVLIPESLLQKEGELVNGFAPVSSLSSGILSGYFPSVRMSYKYLLSRIISFRISCQFAFFLKNTLKIRKFMIDPITGVVMPKASV